MPEPRNHTPQLKCQKCGARKDLQQTGWGRHCIPCLHDVRYAGSPGYRARHDAQQAYAAELLAKSRAKKPAPPEPTTIWR